ncbi:C4-dicarboxylate ABC transporter permease [Falsiroseomonas bella]|uniref:TRAP transporter small permease protein n=1 Tax=Falsiroseomonas bella TaxID=2184016 RepID=A0A317FEK9_9PROT|nr:TRAP transporter small permease [Falsiroseomonas bella]PWS37534.1 C4-dicarboxylate ABC transporter permease [Falsiroseomonas bella]
MSEHADLQAPGLKLGEAPPRIPVTIEGAVGALIMGVLALITFGNVVVRYFTNVSFAFTEEYSVALMVVMTFVGAAAAFGADRHIRMTFFTERLAPRNARRVEILVLLTCLFVFGAVAWLGAWYTWDEYRFEVLTPGLGVPSWYYTVWMPLLSVVICLRILGRMWRVLRVGL